MPEVSKEENGRHPDAARQPFCLSPACATRVYIKNKREKPVCCAKAH